VVDEQGSALAKKDGALKGVALSAAVGVAVYGLRKALAGSGAGLSLHHADDEAHGENSRSRSGSLLTSAVESASDSLLPLVEAAAEEAGRWAAKNSPALIRDRLLPRFIDAFKAAA
jgi:hypothetical protein